VRKKRRGRTGNRSSFVNRRGHNVCFERLERLNRRTAINKLPTPFETALKVEGAFVEPLPPAAWGEKNQEREKNSFRGGFLLERPIK